MCGCKLLKMKPSEEIQGSPVPVTDLKRKRDSSAADLEK